MTSQHADDLALVRRMLAGEQAAFTDFGDRYLLAVYRFTLSRLAGERELARDLAQAALCKALAHLDSFRGDASLLTWLCSCARNEILMHQRSMRSRGVQVSGERALEAGVEGNGHRPESPEHALLRGESGELVHLSLDLLPARYARALEWKYLEDLPVKEIAARLEVAPKAADSLLARARQAFRHVYDDLARGQRPPGPTVSEEEGSSHD